jgi:hypothetical protein
MTSEQRFFVHHSRVFGYNRGWNEGSASKGGELLKARIYRLPAAALAALLTLWIGAMSSFADVAKSADTVTLLAEEIPGGFLKIENGKGIGVYPELFYEAAARSGTKLNFRFVPWERAFREVELSNHLMTFPLTRLPKREDRYTWLIPLDRDEIVFVSIDKPIDTLEQARKLGRILVWRGSSMEIFLSQQGFTNVVPVGNTKALVRMLINGRADAWFTIRPEHDEVTGADGRPVKLVHGDVIHGESVWLAGGRSFAHSETSRRFAANVGKLVESGRLRELKEKHGVSQ